MQKMRCTQRMQGESLSSPRIPALPAAPRLPASAAATPKPAAAQVPAPLPQEAPVTAKVALQPMKDLPPEGVAASLCPYSTWQAVFSLPTLVLAVCSAHPCGRGVP